MSMMPLTGMFDLALAFHLISVPVQDVPISSSDGQDVWGGPILRSIDAAVDPTNRRQLEIIFGGSVSDGSLGIVTKDTLYIDDQYATGSERKQSFITYSDILFRVTKSANWQQQTGFTVYLAERHVQQQGNAF